MGRFGDAVPHVVPDVHVEVQQLAPPGSFFGNTPLRLRCFCATSSEADEGMKDKIKAISRRSFGFGSADHFIAAIYHCCARLPMPAEG